MYNPTYNDFETIKDIMAPINASLSSNRDMDFNYIILTTAKCYCFFFFCFHGLILLVGISHGG